MNDVEVLNVHLKEKNKEKGNNKNIRRQVKEPLYGTRHVFKVINSIKRKPFEAF